MEITAAAKPDCQPPNQADTATALKNNANRIIWGKAGPSTDLTTNTASTLWNTTATRSHQGRPGNR